MNNNNVTDEQLQRLSISSENAAVSKQIIIEFFEWFPNVNNTDIEEVISILDDFAKSNEHIIQRIKKISI